jgi:hypothetical protein
MQRVVQRYFARRKELDERLATMIINRLAEAFKK